MVDENANQVPVWTLATREVSVPTIAGDEPMSPERLEELRTVLAVLADAPIVTLEAHPLPKSVNLSQGIHLESSSPLATHLSQLITETPGAAPVVGIGTSLETLYRMIVPAKVAAQIGTGFIKPMLSKTEPGSVLGALIGTSGRAAKETFVPVAGKAAVAGTTTGSAATAGVAVGGSAALTVAAPLVMLAVAVGVSAQADHKRQRAVENITKLLEKLHSDSLESEKSRLNGCRDAIEKATAVLLDQGRVGASLGLDSAVHSISVALADAELRLQKWQRGLKTLQEGRVELAPLRKEFAGIDEESGEFRAHLELASLAIALKKRVIVLQAVEHAQMDRSNSFDSFVRTLNRDQQRVAKLETDIDALLHGLSMLELDRSHGVRDVVFKAGDVDKLLRTSRRLRELGSGIDTTDRQTDVAIDIARSSDASIVVLPARPA
ncbi:hypothetical protein OG921_04645 [Aldersonia sp. NBC_00410]|uniref:hypothetical protein n=1 Tax=Aldersonia sp. NBC_00410 TaxID=2975954 RepID=UPI00225590D4|nr:hypothetical protein [Aldersonia sp. NBC_00410]MCX5042461.1 hypothetical protein [Aldersonia sp. NBC_00410]